MMALVLAAGLLPDPPPRADLDGPAGRPADEGAASRASHNLQGAGLRR